MPDLTSIIPPRLPGLVQPVLLGAIGWYALISLITLLTYAADKRNAALGRWRVPNARLHLLALLGGWPGAMLAQGALRHKSRQPAFQAVTFAAALLHTALWATLSWFS